MSKKIDFQVMQKEIMLQSKIRTYYLGEATRIHTIN